jgi:hypothetical protein
LIHDILRHVHNVMQYRVPAPTIPPAAPSVVAIVVIVVLIILIIITVVIVIVFDVDLVRDN